MGVCNFNFNSYHGNASPCARAPRIPSPRPTPHLSTVRYLTPSPYLLCHTYTTSYYTCLRYLPQLPHSLHALSTAATDTPLDSQYHPMDFTPKK